jgi:hypothetical protein
MKPMQSTIYVVLGTREEVGQSVYNGPFESSFHKECVIAFSTREKAENYIASQKLVKPKKESFFSGTAYYRNDYYNLEIESVEVKS